MAVPGPGAGDVTPAADHAPGHAPGRPARPFTAVVLFAGLAVLMVAGTLSVVPPRALSSDAPPDVFSAGRALEHVRDLCRAPHSFGSTEHARVREALQERLRALGVEPVVHVGEFMGTPLHNILVRIPGRGVAALDAGLDHGAALLLAAHYDSVGAGPGAGDDGSGMSALIETLRWLLTRPPPRHDVIFLWSDAEEWGLRGARHFAADHGWMADVRAVVNVEARGNAGPAVLFETGPRSGRLVAQLARRTRSVWGSSAGPAVYARMGNDTDFSVFRDAGLPGLNFALVGGATAYHRPWDSAENLRPASVQQQGEILSAMVASLEELELARPPGVTEGSPVAAADRSFFTLPVFGLVHYPAWLDLGLGVGAVLMLVVMLRSGVRGGRLRGRRLREALIVAPLLAVVAATGAVIAWFAVDALAFAVLTAPAPRGDLASTLVSSNGVVLMTLWAVLALLPRVRGRSLRAAEVGAAALVWWALLAVIVLVEAPGAAHLMVLPLMSGAVSLGFFLVRTPEPTGDGPPPRRLMVALPLLPALLLLLPTMHVFALVAGRAPLAGAVVAAAFAALTWGLALPSLQHLLWTAPRLARRLALFPGLVLLILGAVLRVRGG